LTLPRHWAVNSSLRRPAGVQKQRRFKLGVGDNTEMGTLAATEELHAKQKAQGCGARGQEGAAGRGCGCEGRSRRTSVQKGFGRPEQSSSRSTRNRRPSAGLKPGDLVTELDGTPVRDAPDL
jgi:hypothetical protein